MWRTICRRSAMRSTVRAASGRLRSRSPLRARRGRRSRSCVTCGARSRRCPPPLHVRRASAVRRSAVARARQSSGLRALGVAGDVVMVARRDRGRARGRRRQWVVGAFSTLSAPPGARRVADWGARRRRGRSSASRDASVFVKRAARAARDPAFAALRRGPARARIHPMRHLRAARARRSCRRSSAPVRLRRSLAVCKSSRCREDRVLGPADTITLLSAESRARAGRASSRLPPQAAARRHPELVRDRRVRYRRSRRHGLPDDFFGRSPRTFGHSERCARSRRSPRNGFRCGGSPLRGALARAWAAQHGAR